MVIYSVTPAHMLTWPAETPDFTTKQLGNTFVDVYETPEGKCMSGIHTTDLSVYLKPGNTPGSKFVENSFR